MLVDKSDIKESIDLFQGWLNSFGDISYDRMDYWSSSPGILAKKLFYTNKVIGAPLALWGLILENFLPNLQKLYSTPHREVIGDAHFALGYLNLFQISKNEEYLSKANSYLAVMKSTSTKGYSGYAWGYTFGWQQSKGKFWKPGTPMITITPYAFWAYKKHYELTQNQESYDIAVSIANFALKDLNEVKMPNGTICSSYSPISEDIVINANSYRAAILNEAYDLCGKEDFKKAADANIEFILSYQGKDGEWFYEAKGETDNFIDNFHTCFILRNLYKCYLINGDKELLASIKKGYKYYQKYLFYENGRPKHFAKAKYAKLRKYEMYDYAEGISLGILLKDEIPAAFEVAQRLAKDLIENFQTPKGHFLTRVTSLGTNHKVPYLRWPQAQLFYALTNIYKVIPD